MPTILGLKWAGALFASADCAPKGGWSNVPRTARPPFDPLNQSNGEGERKPLRDDKPAADKLCGGVKSNGVVCKLPSGHGTDHLGWGRCKWHGGVTPSGKKSAAKDMAGALIKFYGGPVDTNPIDALLDEVRRTAGHVSFLGQKVSGWQFSVEDGEGVPIELKGWIDLYQSERAHLVRVSTAALNAGVNERLVALAEHQGMRLADAIDQILAGLQLSVEQRRLVPEIVPAALRNLRVIEGEVVE